MRVTSGTELFCLLNEYDNPSIDEYESTIFDSLNTLAIFETNVKCISVSLLRCSRWTVVLLNNTVTHLGGVKT